MKTKGQFILFSVDEFAQWLANTEFERKIIRIQNHHTWKPSYASFDGGNHFKLLADMKAWHVNHNGWADIGQNLTIFPDGTVAVCRSFERTPACIFGANSGCICIESVGNFDKGGDKMTDAQRQAIVRVNALLCKEFKLTPNSDDIVYHHWYNLDNGDRNNGTKNNKSCPGTAFFGGNKVAHAEANFLPLVAVELGRIAGAQAVPVFKVMSPDGVLSVRATPKGSGTELTRLSNGDTVKVFEIRGLWRRIDADEQRWVSSKFLVPA